MSNLDEIHKDIVPSRLVSTAVRTLVATPVLFAKLAESRTRLIVQNNSASTITIGGNSSITVGTGYFVPPAGILDWRLGADALVYGCCSSPASTTQVEHV
jgi:hypothetical protein